MNQGITKFMFVTDDGKEIEYEKLLSFRSGNKYYMVVTDNTEDEEGNLNTYAYYFEQNNLDLRPVLDEKEIEMVDRVYNKVNGEV